MDMTQTDTVAMVTRPGTNGAAPGGQIEYKWIVIGELFWPAGLQRELKERAVQKIIARYNPAAFATPIISYREPGNRGLRGEPFAVVAGWHRVEAARRMGMTRVFCQIVYGLDAADEARLFVDEDSRTEQSPLHKYHLDRQANDPAAVAVWDIVTAAHYVIPKAKSTNLRNGELVCVREVMATYSIGVLPDVLATLSGAWGRDGEGNRTQIVGGLATLFRHRGAVIDRGRLCRKLGEAGPALVMTRYRNAVAVTRAQSRLVMANTIIDIYNSHLRTGALDYVSNVDSGKVGGAASVIARSGKGKTLAEARAEVAARATVNA